MAGRRVLVSVVVLSLVSAGCGGGDGEESTSTTTTSPSSTPPETAAGEELRLGGFDAVRVEVPSPDWLAADDSFVYVKLDGGEVNRIDPTTGAVVAAAEIEGERGVSGSGCQGIGTGFDSVWTCFGSDVVRMGLDPFAEVSRIAARKTATQGHIGTGFDRVWILQGDGSALAGIDPETETVGEPFPLPVRGTDLAVGDDGIWIVSALDDAVLLVDPTDGSVLHRIDGLRSPATLSVVGDVVWVGDTSAVHRIDPATGTITSSIEGGPGRSGALAVDGDGVWVRRDDEFRRVDAATGAVAAAFGLDLEVGGPGDMLVAFGALWASASEDAALFRIALD